MAKSIYLRVINSEPNNLEGPDGTPKSFKGKVKKAVKTHPMIEASEFVKKLAEKAKNIDPYKLSPEELKDYDEIQRLEIMLRNLRLIQKGDLINTEKNNNTTVYTEKPNWEQYAGEINDDALERRSIRKGREDEKLARFAKSMSPRPMEKLDIPVQSLFGSALLRQSMFGNKEEGGNPNSQRSYFKGDGKQAENWVDMDIYERNIMWLNARNEKLEKIDRDLTDEAVKECSFKPTSFTNLYSPLKTSTTSPNRITDRETNEKSLYKEKKGLETYHELFDLKKTYNLYKSEIFFPRRIDTAITPKIERSQSNHQAQDPRSLIRVIHTDA